jgi:hypothetical protein
VGRTMPGPLARAGAGASSPGSASPVGITAMIGRMTPTRKVPVRTRR